jgi:hypothetical protein
MAAQAPFTGKICCIGAGYVGGPTMAMVLFPVSLLCGDMPYAGQHAVQCRRCLRAMHGAAATCRRHRDVARNLSSVS